MNQGSGRFKFLKELLLHPLFLGVLLLKLWASTRFASHFLRGWFEPFTAWFVASHFENPWQHFLALGEPQAFPYPPGMLYILAAFRWLLQGMAPLDQAGTGMSWLAMRLPLLLADVGIYAVLASWFRDRIDKVRFWYWASPVVFYVSYFHGQLDLIPTALFTLCLFHLGRRRFWVATLLYGLALSTKNHLWIALPFLLVYLRPQLGWARLLGFAALPLAVYFGISLPYLSDPAYKAMVLQNEQQSWVFLLNIPIGKWNTAFLFCPAALIFVFAKYSGYARQNWDLTLLFLGLAFIAFVLLVPPMPGWYLWSIPFLIFYLCRFQKGGGLLLSAFSAAFLAYFLLGQRSDFMECRGLAAGASTVSTDMNNLYFTLMQSSLAALALVMYTTGVRSNEVYTSRSKPLLLGIAGDSGAGKDRLASALSRLFGERDVIRLAGDDYHRWERGDQHWSVLTHLNPSSNRLHEQLEHMVALREGRGISKVSYDHQSGRFSEKEGVDPRKNIIVQGLHSFLLEKQRQLFDLKVFLDPEEKLRVYWKLQRDHVERGHPVKKVMESLKKRAKDRASAVLPQRNYADLVFRVRAENAAALKDLKNDPALMLEIEGSNHFDFESLAQALSGIGLKCGLEYPSGLARIRLTVKGQPSEEDINRLWPALLPELPERLSGQPRFIGGLDGIMLLSMMVALEANLKFARSQS